MSINNEKKKKLKIREWGKDEWRKRGKEKSGEKMKRKH